jgi:hypothetical protein
VLAGLLAIRMARLSGVVGKAAIPPLCRGGFAAAALFAVGGFGLTRLLLPAGLRRHEPLWILPIGACAVALNLTVLGFAGIPFKLSLALTIAAGTAVGVFAWRRSGPPGGWSWEGAAWPAYLAVLIAAIALIPLFRAGFATVEGQGQDAHLAVGTAQFLQKHYPTSVHPEEPVDRVPLVWKSKQPIYYTLGATATLSGLEVYETISALAAVMLALAALGFFLVTRELLRAPPWAALSALALVGLDRMVLHTVMHPYFNQTWGFFAMPFAMVLAWWCAEQRTRGGLILLALFLAIMAFAYPLAVPIALIPLVVVLWPERKRLHPRRLYHGRRSLLWMAPLALVLVVPIRGVIEKVGSAGQVVFNRSLTNWGGDLHGYFAEQWFLGNDHLAALILVSPLLLYGAWLALRDRPVALRRGLVGVFVFAAGFAVFFRLRDVGYYFHFKVLAFVAPLFLATAVAGLGLARQAVAARLAVALLLVLAIGSAITELGKTFDELPRNVLQLRSIDSMLPAGASVRLDIDPQEQNWVAYMLHGQPLCSRLPLLHTSYPHVRTSRKADYILTKIDAPVPQDAVYPSVVRLEAFKLFRMKRSVRGPANCSQRMVQTVESIHVS